MGAVETTAFALSLTESIDLPRTESTIASLQPPAPRVLGEDSPYGGQTPTVGAGQRGEGLPLPA